MTEVGHAAATTALRSHNGADPKFGTEKEMTPPLPDLPAGGAKVPRGTLLRHVSADVALREEGREERWGEELEGMGYQSTRSSVWVLQVKPSPHSGGGRCYLG